MIIHKKPGNRASWDYHGRQGWYIGPAPEHYRCFRCFIPSTGREIVTDSLRFIPGKIHFPTISIEKTLQSAIDKIIKNLQQLPVQNSIFSSHKNTILKAFRQVATTLNNNPKMFTKHDPTSNKKVPINGPRTWIPVKKNVEPSIPSNDTPNMPGETRVRTKFPPVSYTTIRRSTPATDGKMVVFHHNIPITYPTGKNVLPPPTNLPIFPASIPSETPKNFQAQLFHV